MPSWLLRLVSSRSGRGRDGKLKRRLSGKRLGACQQIAYIVHFSPLAFHVPLVAGYHALVPRSRSPVSSQRVVNRVALTPRTVNQALTAAATLQFRPGIPASVATLPPSASGVVAGCVASVRVGPRFLRTSPPRRLSSANLRRLQRSTRQKGSTRPAPSASQQRRRPQLPRLHLDSHPAQTAPDKEGSSLAMNRLQRSPVSSARPHSR
jgi:hypothetical protein